MRYSGSDWLAPALARWGKPPMSALGVAVADIVGAVYRGIYHLPVTALKKAEWHDTHLVRVLAYGELATFDADLLTSLVVLAHERCVRIAVEPRNMRYVQLRFSPREGRLGQLSARHPSMGAAVLRVRDEFRLGAIDSDQTWTVVREAQDGVLKRLICREGPEDWRSGLLPCQRFTSEQKAVEALRDYLDLSHSARTS